MLSHSFLYRRQRSFCKPVRVALSTKMPFIMSKSGDIWFCLDTISDITEKNWKDLLRTITISWKIPNTKVMLRCDGTTAIYGGVTKRGNTLSPSQHSNACTSSHECRFRALYYTCMYTNMPFTRIEKLCWSARQLFHPKMPQSLTNMNCSMRHSIHKDSTFWHFSSRGLCIGIRTLFCSNLMGLRSKGAIFFCGGMLRWVQT